MANITWYGDGTATATTGSKVVTGTGTGWLSSAGGLTPIKVGDKFGLHVGRPIVIAEIVSDTELLLTDDWPGPDQTDASYKVELTNPAIAAVEAMRRLLAQLDNGTLAGISELNVGLDQLIIGSGLGTFTTIDKAELGGGGTGAGDVVGPAGGVSNGQIAGFLGTDGKAIKGLTLAEARAAVGGVREVLTANRTYYVRTNGSNSNDGLANTAAGAFRTIQAAILAVAKLDISTFNVTIQLADGTYGDSITVTGGWIGSGTVTILGNNTSPGNVLLQHSVVGGLLLSGPSARIAISGFKITNSVYSCINCVSGSSVTIAGPIIFGGAARAHIECESFSSCSVNSNYTIDGSAQIHWMVYSSGNISLSSRTVSVVGSVGFSIAFASATTAATIVCYALTKSGSATGKYYEVAVNGAITTYGSGASALFGNTAGTAATGGQYT